MSINDRIRARFTPTFVRSLAAEGNPLLTAIPRYESWTGHYLIAGGVQMERAQDYEVTVFLQSSPSVDVLAACDRAVRALGRRLEGCLRGERSAKDFRAAIDERPATKGQGIDTPRGPHAPRLYSLGPCPRLLDSDGLVMLRVRPEDAPIIMTGEEAAARPGRAKALFAKYGDRLFDDIGSDAYRLDANDPAFQVRFGYYAQTGPDDPAYSKERSP